MTEHGEGYQTSQDRSRYFLSGGGGSVEPTPDKARWGTLMAGLNLSGEIIAVNDTAVIADSGAIDSNQPPDAIAGATNMIAVEGGAFGHSNRQIRGEFIYYSGRRIRIKGTFRVDYNIVAAVMNHYQGAQTGIETIDPLALGNTGVFIGVQKGFNLGFGNYQLFINNGGVVTQVDTGIACPAGGQRIKWQIDVLNGLCTLSINGQAVASGSGLPVNAVLSMCWALRGNDTASGGTSFGWFEYIYLENAT